MCIKRKTILEFNYIGTHSEAKHFHVSKVQAMMSSQQVFRKVDRKMYNDVIQYNSLEIQKLIKESERQNVTRCHDDVTSPRYKSATHANGSREEQQGVGEDIAVAWIKG